MAKHHLLSLMVAVSLTGCQMAAMPQTPATVGNSLMGPGRDASAEMPQTPGTVAPPSAAPSMAPPMAPTAGATADKAEGGAGFAAGEPYPSQVQQQEALKAGAVDDNAKYSDFLKYVTAYAGIDMRPLDVSRRFVVQVVDADGHAVSNAAVAIAAGTEDVTTVKTYANGQTLFHPGAYPAAAKAESFKVTATLGEQTISQTFDGEQEGVWKLTLPAAVAKPAAKLDVLFVLDATGSMGGEIDRLQSTIKTMASRIQALPHQPTVRFGLVAYRDQAEEYVTRKTEFTSDMDAFKAALDKIQAEGGGDKPEDVESALAAGVSSMEWRTDDTVRLSFLVADAAPHVDYEQATPYTTSLKRATEKGIKVFPIGCSGLEKEGEYAFRQMAQFTMGQYLFITRGGDESTDGGGAASATVDKFQEGRLDDIVVDIVEKELDFLGR